MIPGVWTQISIHASIFAGSFDIAQPPHLLQLFFNFLQTLIDKKVVVTVELKNDLQITGVLHSIDQYLNIKLSDTSVNQNESFVYLGSLKNCFIRGSVVRYIFFPPSQVDVDLLQKACRKELRSQSETRENKGNVKK